MSVCIPYEKILADTQRELDGLGLPDNIRYHTLKDVVASRTMVVQAAKQPMSVEEEHAMCYLWKLLQRLANVMFVTTI